MHYHLIGIAGTAMGSLAGLLREKGHRVTGSDEGVYPPMSTMLDDLGISYARRFSPENLEPSPDVVIVGNAISRGNPELEAVLDRHLHYTSAAQVVKEEFLRSRHVLAVAGTHGKTTTSAILAWLLEVGGLEPSFLVGGVCENFGRSFRLRESEYFVIEADEYDTAYFDKGPKMWHYLPRTAILTNVEFDHADIYRDEIAYRFAFERFINLIPGSGTLIVGWDSRIARELSDRSFAPVESFSTSPPDHRAPLGDPSPPDDGTPPDGRPPADAPTPAGTHHPRWWADRIQYRPERTTFRVIRGGEVLGSVETVLSGAFNIRNVLAATAAAHSVGVGFDAIREGLASFRSVRRRMEIRGEVRGVTVIDDFAHHPTAVRGVIEAARQRFRGRRVVAIFEPRSYTAQRREFQEAYTEALSGADRVVLAGLFHPERYDAATGMDPSEVVAALKETGVEAEHTPDVDRIVSTVAPSARSGDVLLVMSNGGFGGIHAKLLAALEAGMPT